MKTVVIAGASGVGKTAVRERLAPKLGAASFGPDDFKGDWPALLNALDYEGLAVVECCKVPAALRKRLVPGESLVVELTASPETRERRLAERGEMAEVIRRRLEENPAIYYGESLQRGLDRGCRAGARGHRRGDRGAMLTSRLDNIAASLDEEIETPIRALAEMIEQEAKARVPVDSGDLRDAIHSDKLKDGTYAVIAGAKGVFYGHIVENGSVKSAPHPFLVPAFESVRDRADELIKTHFKDL